MSVCCRSSQQCKLPEAASDPAPHRVQNDKQAVYQRFIHSIYSIGTVSPIHSVHEGDGPIAPVLLLPAFCTHYHVQMSRAEMMAAVCNRAVVLPLIMRRMQGSPGAPLQYPFFSSVKLDSQPHVTLSHNLMVSTSETNGNCPPPPLPPLPLINFHHFHAAN
jgi:hypothetical protein